MLDTIEIEPKEAEFIAAYLEAIDFTETGDIGQPEKGAELCETFERESVIDCLAFFSRIRCYLSDDNITQAGIDFWLSRNGHGTGFWDRGDTYKTVEGFDYKDTLDKLAESFGTADAIFNELPQGV